jgi:hypothetical protein
MAFAREHYDSKSRHKVSFDDSYIAMTLYLQYKSEFFGLVIENIFSNMPYTDEYKTSVVKEAMTAIGFGAKLTMGEWKDSSGDTHSSSLRDVFNKNETLLSRFVNCFIVRQFNKEQQVLNKYIVQKFSSDDVWLKELEDSRTNRKVKPYKQSQKISWLYQHAETIMMDMVRNELKTLGKTVLANVHDAIVVKERLTDSERLMIENLVKAKTSVEYFALGETQYSACLK